MFANIEDHLTLAVDSEEVSENFLQYPGKFTRIFPERNRTVYKLSHDHPLIYFEREDIGNFKPHIEDGAVCLRTNRPDNKTIVVIQEDGGTPKVADIEMSNVVAFAFKPVEVFCVT